MSRENRTFHVSPEWNQVIWPDLPSRPLITGSGRGALHLIEHPRGILLERAYRHGGLRRLFFADYFRAGKRPAQELTAHQRAWQAGIATAEPVGWAEEKALPLLRRYFYYSVFLEGTLPLPQRITATPNPASYAGAIARILWGLYENHIYHHDLNLNNWLVDEQGRVFLIDFDRAQLGPREKLEFLTACLRRMIRSARRLGLGHHRRLFLRLVIECCRYFELPVRTLIRALPHHEIQRRWYHRWIWKISGGHYRVN